MFFLQQTEQLYIQFLTNGGKQGWTFIEMKEVHKDLFADALTTAYCEVAPKKLADQIRPNESEDKTANNPPLRQAPNH